MGSLWAVELDVDRRRASPIFCGLARGEVRTAGVGVEESRSCELIDWVLLRHGEEPVDGDAIVAIIISRVGRARATSSIQRGLAMSKNYVSDGNMMQSGTAVHGYPVTGRATGFPLGGSLIYYRVGAYRAQQSG